MATKRAITMLSLPASVRQALLARSALQQTSPTIVPAHVCKIRSYSTEAQSNSPTSSVNATEVSHFNTLASEWWDPHGSSRLLHLMNPLRHEFINHCLATNPLPANTANKRKYLDIGCGGGIFAESAARLGATRSVTAVDPTPEVINVAKRHQRTDPLLLQPGRLDYQNIPVESLPLAAEPEEAFDIVSLFEVIEHIQSPPAFLRTVLQHLKPGGWFIGSTIARTGTSWFTTKFMAEEVLRMVPRGTHDWSQYIQPSEMREWTKSHPDLDHGSWHVMGVVYVPGFGWKKVGGSEDWGNYFFGIRKKALDE
jgi:polyprenyldihydroxybenzoate methyltransferase/3-demethylubiquinol 3-O-methyltransferase